MRVRFSALYVRAPRLVHDLAIARGDGSYGRLLARLAKMELLAIDDWLLAPLEDAERRDLLEVLEDRAERRRKQTERRSTTRVATLRSKVTAIPRNH